MVLLLSVKKHWHSYVLKQFLVATHFRQSNSTQIQLICNIFYSSMCLMDVFFENESIGVSSFALQCLVCTLSLKHPSKHIEQWNNEINYCIPGIAIIFDVVSNGNGPIRGLHFCFRYNNIFYHFQ